MNSRNGISKQFRFIVDDSVVLDFSFKHHRLEEWTQEKWTVAKLIDGRIKQKFLYLHTYFRIDWSELIVGEDADKLSVIRNSEFAGSKLIVIPHIDLPGRFFDVISLKSDSGDSEQINFSQIINSRNSPGNRGTIMVFQTKYPQYHWDIRDPSNQPLRATRKIQRLVN